MTRACHPRQALIGVLVVASLSTGMIACAGDDADEESTSATGALTADELPVIVVVEPIEQGTPADGIDDDSVDNDVVLRADFPDDAVIDLTVLDGLVTRLPLAPGTILRHAHFEDPSSG